MHSAPGLLLRLCDRAETLSNRKIARFKAAVHSTCKDNQVDIIDIMSGAITVNVAFQAKSGSTDCTPETVQMNSADMKSLKVKTGAYVEAALPYSSVLLQVWPSKKALAGTVALNRVWQHNFAPDQRKIKLSPLTGSIRMVIASEVTLTFTTTPTAAVNCEQFRNILRCLLGKTPIRLGLAVGLTYRCEPIVLKVESCQSLAIGTDAETRLFYQLATRTKLTITDSAKAQVSAASLLNSMVGEVPTGLAVLQSRVAGTGFAGYRPEVVDALKVAAMGLGLSHLLRQTPVAVSTTSPAEATGSGWVVRDLMRPPKGLILYGAPGTGKTTLMHAIVAALGCNCLELSHSLLLSRYEGDAERTVTKIFKEAAARAPCCILVDNIDLLCYSRTAPGASELQKRIVACILTLMDGVSSVDANLGTEATPHGGVFVIGTTARIGDLDAALRRAGRIDKEVEIGVPSSADREEILLALLRKAGVPVGDIDVTGAAVGTVVGLSQGVVRSVAQQAHGMVGADLLSVVKEAFFLTHKERNSIVCGESGTGNSITGNVTAPSASVADKDASKSEMVETIEISVGNLADEFADLDMDDEQPGHTGKAASTANEHCSTAEGQSLGPLGTGPVVAAAPVSFLVANATAPLDGGGVSVITEAALRLAVSRVSPSALREVVIEVPSVRWGDIGGMETVKQSLREVVEWPLQRPELFASLGIAPPKGVLLYGPPGCSKTLMAKALATESSMNFLAVRGPELLSKWLGESEKAVQALFRRARAAAPSIVFFDEIDALAGKRGDVSSGVSDRVLSQLLTELDGVHGLKQVIVIAATNRPDMLDPALIRPGRIDRKIYVPPPDEGSRWQILQLELKKMPLTGDFNYDELVLKTAGFSGAEIVGVCTEAAMLAIEGNEQYLRCEHVLRAIADVKPQITPTMLEFYRSCAAKF